MINPILLAEDSADDAEVIRHLLTKAGVNNPVTIVSNGLEAIAYLNGDGAYADRTQFPVPAVLLLDLKMPKCDGFEVLEWIKSRPQFEDLLVVVLSGLSDMTSINRAYSLGAHSFLTKPCQVEDMVNLTKSFQGYWDSATVNDH